MAEREVKLRFAAEGAEEVSRSVAKIGDVSTEAAKDTTELGKAGEKTSVSLSDLSNAASAVAKGIAIAGAAAAAAVTGFGVLTVKLADAGESVGEVRTAFDAFTKNIEGGEAILGKLREATTGEVDDLKLMKGVLDFAKRGVKLTADEFGALALIAKKNADIGGDFSSVLQKVSRGFAGATASSLANAIGIENLSESELKLAAGIEDTAGPLTTQQKQLVLTNLLTKRAAELEGELGKGFNSAGDQIAVARAAISNWTDDLKVAFAASPELMASIDDLFASLGKLGAQFGIATGTGGSFGSTMGKIASVVIDKLGAVVDFVSDSIVPIVKGFAGGFAGGFGEIQEAAGRFAATIGDRFAAIGGFLGLGAGDFGSFAQAAGGFLAVFIAKVIDGFTTVQEFITGAIEGVFKFSDGFKAALAESIVQIKTFAELILKAFGADLDFSFEGAQATAREFGVAVGEALGKAGEAILRLGIQLRQVIIPAAGEAIQLGLIPLIRAATEIGVTMNRAAGAAVLALKAIGGASVAELAQTISMFKATEVAIRSTSLTTTKFLDRTSKAAIEFGKIGPESIEEFREQVELLQRAGVESAEFKILFGRESVEELLAQAPLIGAELGVATSRAFAESFRREGANIPDALASALAGAT